MLFVIGFILLSVLIRLRDMRIIRDLRSEQVRLQRLQHSTFKHYCDELDKNYDLQRRLILASK